MKAILAKAKYRNKLEIHKDLLEFCLEQRSKTRVIYGCVMTTERMAIYIQELVNAGMLEVLQDGRRTDYKTTEKGKEYLKSLQKAISFLL